MFHHCAALVAASRFIFASLLISVLLAACGGGGGGSEVPPVPPSPPIPAPVPPAAPTVSLSFDIKQLQLSWSAVAGANFYRVWQSDDGIAPFTQVGGDMTATSASLSFALHQQVNARYQVQACNTAGCTDSTVISVASELSSTSVQKLVGYVKASNTGANHYFGLSVALSQDGNTMAVGAYTEDGGATGVNGDQGNDSAPDSGAVYIFVRTGSGWTQQAYLKASNTEAGDQFGAAVALSADGNMLAIGVLGEDSKATGINASGLNGDQADNSAKDSGAVYVFVRNAGIWEQEAYVKASNTGAGDGFGLSVKLSADGNLLAVGAPYESSSAMGIDGNQADNTATKSGAVYVFVRKLSAWTQQAYVKASNTDANDEFGYSLALSADGTTLAVGAYGEDSSAVGLIGNQNDNSASYSGAVYVFTRSGSAWSQQAYVKASNTGQFARFGWSLGLSTDGNTLAVGARNEASSAKGINGDQNNVGAPTSGAVYVFVRSSDSTWAQQAYIKASNTEKDDRFSWALAVSADGNMLAVGAYAESSSAIGVGGDQADNGSLNSGAVYTFVRSGSTWTQQAYVKATNTGDSDRFGASLALSADGKTMAVGAWQEGSSATGIGGNQADNSADRSGAVYLF
jgi:hypothetical protein